MARPPKELGTYPKRFLDIAESAFRGAAIEQVRMPDQKAVISTIHSFNRFRVAMAKQGHPHAGAVNDLIVRGSRTETAIEFIARGLWTAESEGPLDVPGLEGFLASAASSGSSSEGNRSGSDFTEKALEGFMKGGGCSHERNDYGICVKCGEPL